jgi:hypothetical protein
MDISSLLAMYEKLNPEQRASVAKQFHSALQEAGHPEAEALTQVAAEHATAEDLAKLHVETGNHSVGLLRDVLGHPVVTAAIGAFATHELDKHFGHR